MYESPISEFFFPGPHKVAVATFGGNSSPMQAAVAWCIQAKCGIDHHICPPSRYNDPGFRIIAKAEPPYTQYTDGMEVPSGVTIGIRSKDCPIVVLFDAVTDSVVAFHAGRPALSPQQYNGNPYRTVIDAGMEYLLNQGALAKNVFGYVTAGICPQCFLHDTSTGKKLAEPFVNEYGDRVIGLLGELDLALVIELQLQQHGVPGSNITYDRNCTREHPLLASHRNGDKDSNMVVIAHF